MKIDKDKVYTYGKYSYVNFTKLSYEELLQVLEWRNHPDVRKCMNNIGYISEKEHLAFCKSLKFKSDTFYWVIVKENQHIGVLNIIDVDYENCTCEPGFYLSPSIMGHGESLFVLSNYKSFLLNSLGFKGLVGHNYYDNKPAFSFTIFFGGLITELQYIGGRFSVKTLLTKENFKNGDGTEKLISKYAKFIREWNADEEINKFKNEK